MRLVDVIEECSLYSTPDEVVWQITRTYSDQDLDRLIHLFLRGIGSQHQVRGQVVYDLADISHKYREFGTMTRDQKIYVIGRIIANWSHVTCQARAEMML